MLNKYSSNGFPDEEAEDLYHLYGSKLKTVAREHDGTHAEPFLRMLYGNLMDDANALRVYEPGTFPELNIYGSPEEIKVTNSPLLGQVLTNVGATLGNIVDTTGSGDVSCLGVTGKIPSSGYMRRNTKSHNGVPSALDAYDLFDAQRHTLHDAGGFSQCRDLACQSCPVCTAAGEAMKRHYFGVFTSSGLVVPAHFNSLITVGNVWKHHLMQLGSSEDTKDDPRYNCNCNQSKKDVESTVGSVCSCGHPSARHNDFQGCVESHGADHGRAASVIQAITTTIHHAGIKDHIESGGVGGFPREPRVILATRPRFTTPEDPAPLTPTGKYNADAQRRKKSRG